MLTHFMPYIDEYESMEAPQDHVLNTQPVIVGANTAISMIDGKMVGLIQGDSGSFCCNYNVTRAEANDLTCILKGFVVEKTAEEMAEKWVL